MCRCVCVGDKRAFCSTLSPAAPHPSEKCFVEITSITSIDLISTPGRRDFVAQIDELSISTSIR